MAARSHLLPLLAVLSVVAGAGLWWSIAGADVEAPAAASPGAAPRAGVEGRAAADDAAGAGDREGGPAIATIEVAAAGGAEPDKPVPEDSSAEPEADTGAEPAVDADAGALMLLYDDLVVLAVAPDPAWGAPPIASERFGERLIVRQRAAPERLPPALRGLVGAELLVYDGEGEPCLTALVGVDLYAEAPAAGEGREDGDDAGASAGEAEARARSRRLLARPLLLVGEQDPERLCPGLFARRADLPPARVFAREAIDGDEALALQAALGALAGPERAALRARVGDDAAALTPRLVRFRERAGPRDLVAVEFGDPVDAGDPGDRCDDGDDGDDRDVPAPIGFLAERQGDRWVRLAAPAAIGVEAIVDLDRDGHLALVSQSGGRWALEAGGPKAATRRVTFAIPAPACRI